MNYNLFELPAKAISGIRPQPFVSALHCNSKNNLVCGLMWSSPCLFEVRLGSDGSFLSFEDLALEEALEDKSLWGVGHGLRSTTSGDTALVSYHKGFLPSFLTSLIGSNPLTKSGDALRNFLLKQDDGMGGILRHSIVQIVNHEFKVRRFKDPGMVWDVAHIGDYIFGLQGQALWREPYLHTEKRETLRKDLGPTYFLHKDKSDEGFFWLFGNKGRLLRMALTDIKAKPTPIRFADETGMASSAAGLDGWLYFTNKNCKQLARVRRNPVSHEEESQVLLDSDLPIRAVCQIPDASNKGRIVFSVERKEGAEIKGFEISVPEDAESLPPLPKIESLGLVAGLSHLGALTLWPFGFENFDESASENPKSESPKKKTKIVLWGGEGSWWQERQEKPGTGPRLVQIEL